MNNEGKIINKYLLRNLFNNPTTVYERGAFDGYLNSLTAQPTQNFDQFFSQEVKAFFQPDIVLRNLTSTIVHLS